MCEQTELRYSIDMGPRSGKRLAIGHVVSLDSSCSFFPHGRHAIICWLPSATDRVPERLRLFLCGFVHEPQSWATWIGTSYVGSLVGPAVNSTLGTGARALFVSNPRTASPTVVGPSSAPSSIVVGL